MRAVLVVFCAAPSGNCAATHAWYFFMASSFGVLKATRSTHCRSVISVHGSTGARSRFCSVSSMATFPRRRSAWISAVDKNKARARERIMLLEWREKARGAATKKIVSVVACDVRQKCLGQNVLCVGCLVRWQSLARRREVSRVDENLVRLRSQKRASQAGGTGWRQRSKPVSAKMDFWWILD